MKILGKLCPMRLPNHTNVQYVPDPLYRKLVCKTICGRIYLERKDSTESLFYDLNMFTPRTVYFTQMVIIIRPAITSVQSAVKRSLRREI